MSCKLQMRYFPDEDILHLLIAKGQEAKSMEVSPGVTVELDEDGSVIGVEILDASRFMRDTVLDTMQGRLIQSTKQAA